jgi:hypothetical protein
MEAKRAGRLLTLTTPVIVVKMLWQGGFDPNKVG